MLLKPTRCGWVWVKLGCATTPPTAAINSLGSPLDRPDKAFLTLSAKLFIQRAQHPSPTLNLPFLDLTLYHVASQSSQYWLPAHASLAYLSSLCLGRHGLFWGATETVRSLQANQANKGTLPWLWLRLLSCQSLTSSSAAGPLETLSGEGWGVTGLAT